MTVLKKILIAGLMAASATLMTSTAQAASDDECAIFLCLPSGFPSGCSGAHSAMIKRIKKFKSPLPSFSSCIVSGSSTSGFSSAGGRAARIGNGERWVKGTTCQRRGNPRNGIYYVPTGCTESGYYAEVLVDGVVYNDPYFFTVN